jgi:hypothetical protein
MVAFTLYLYKKGVIRMMTAAMMAEISQRA